jgi:hypothetical protein
MVTVVITMITNPDIHEDSRFWVRSTRVCCLPKMQLGRAISQAVSRWLPTAAARVRSRVWSCGICGGQSGAGAGFLRVLQVLLRIFIPPNSPSSQSPGADTIGQKWPNCRVNPVWTPPPTVWIKTNLNCSYRWTWDIGVELHSSESTNQSSGYRVRIID